MTHNVPQSPTLPNSFFRNNRQRLLAAYDGQGPLVITANGKLQQAMTEGYAFHQDRNFWYLTGIDEPEAIVVIDGSAEYIILRSRGHTQDVFDGGYDVAALQSASGIQDIVAEEEGWGRLTKQLLHSKSVATLEPNPAYIDTFGIFTNPARAELLRRLKDACPDLSVIDLRPQFMYMRMVKQPAEIKLIQQAIDITIAAISEATTAAKRRSYKHEYELEAMITYGMRRRGSHGHAFPPIVAGGQRGCTLHYIENNAALDRNELIVVDVGAEYGHYAADITRTVALLPPTDRQLAVHAAVRDVANYACTLLKPGVLIRDYEKQVETYMGTQLQKLGLIKNADVASIREYFPHATSHFLGLDVHDGGDYDRPLEPGVVMTVEPGIYIHDESIGVRIEDDVLITDDGCFVLTSDIPYELI